LWVGGWGVVFLGLGPKPQTPNPQSPIPNPQKNLKNKIKIYLLIIINNYN